MREATVIISDLSAKGNRIFHTGDTVNEDNFPAGNYDKLVKGGYIKEKGHAPEPKQVTPARMTTSNFNDAKEELDILKNIDLGGKKQK